jgi:predicted metalloprotease with PDZ domain
MTFLLPAVLLCACKKDHHVIKISSKSRTWLGIQVEDLSQKMLQNLDLDNGVRIIKVYDDSPAAEAGIEEDDILISFNGREIENTKELIDFVRDHEIGDEVEITYFRDGEKHSSAVILGETETPALRRMYSRRLPRAYHFKSDGHAWLGIASENLTDQLREYFAVPEDLGILIKEVVDKSPAQEAGLKAGYVIIQVAEKKIKNTRDLQRAIDYFDPDDIVEITFIRDKAEQTLKVQLGEKKGHGPIHIYGIGPENIEIEIPELDIEIPEFEIEIDPQEIEELNKRIQNELKMKTIEIEDKLKELDEKLKKVEVKFRDLDRYII